MSNRPQPEIMIEKISKCRKIKRETYVEILFIIIRIIILMCVFYHTGGFLWINTEWVAIDNAKTIMVLYIMYRILKWSVCRMMLWLHAYCNNCNSSFQIKNESYYSATLQELNEQKLCCDNPNIVEDN